MKIDIAQIDLVLGDKRANLNKALDVVQGSDADLILFPEVFTTGFDFPNLKNLAEDLNGKTVKKIMQACGDKLVAGSIVESTSEGVYNTFLLISKDGILADYRKIHVFQKEKEFFSPGEDVALADTRYGKIGLATCYDLRFPELFRKLMNDGAEIILLCANFPKPRHEHWVTLLKARAIENQVFVAACNRVGADADHGYFGKSMIIDPWGRVVKSADEREEIISCEIDVGQVRRIRNEFPVLEDMRL